MYEVLFKEQKKGYLWLAGFDKFWFQSPPIDYLIIKYIYNDKIFNIILLLLCFLRAIIQ